MLTAVPPASPSALPRLIINADDFGQYERIDDAILTLHRRGAISSTTLVVNGSTALRAVAKAKSQGLPLGLHLNLGEDFSLTGVSSLTDAAGKFLGKKGLRQALDRGGVLNADIDAEILAQIDRFETLVGAPPSHLDGHHHCQVVPQIAPRLAKIMAHHLPGTPLRLPLLHPKLESIEDLIERFCEEADSLAFHRRVQDEASAAGLIFKQHQLPMSDGFFGVALQGQGMTVAALQARLARLRGFASKTIELMCHPGHPVPGAKCFPASPERQQEFDTLCAVFSPAVAGLHPADFSLTNFLTLSACPSPSAP